MTADIEEVVADAEEVTVDAEEEMTVQAIAGHLQEDHPTTKEEEGQNPTNANLAKMTSHQIREHHLEINAQTIIQSAEIKVFLQRTKMVTVRIINKL